MARAPALQLPFTSEALTRARRALRVEWGKEPVIGASGGSIPIVGVFKTDLKMDALMIGFALDDDRVHAPNEKYEVTSFHKGARSWARVLRRLGEVREVQRYHRLGETNGAGEAFIG